MKTAIYIEDGVVQLVITPESEFEKNALKSFEARPTEHEIYHGTFYRCQGGWDRHSNDKDDRSLMIRVANPPENPS